jgi:SAM-dependent methyltransferase
MSTPTAQPGTINWGLGDYETAAVELEPAAAHVVSLAGVEAGEHVLDIATGTGNAALAAARAGATTTGIDAAPRLIELARERAASEGLSVSFEVCDLQELPFTAESFDCVISVFGIIFATDPERAAAEFMRVLARGGRGLISVWVPAGPVDAMIGVFMRAVARATGVQPHRFPWHDEGAVATLFACYGVELQWHRGAVEFTAGSPEEYLDRGRSHPMSVAMMPLLERAGAAAAVQEEALAVLRAGNERADAFLVTSPYRVLEIRRPS